MATLLSVFIVFAETLGIHDLQCGPQRKRVRLNIQFDQKTRLFWGDFYW